MEIEIEFFHKNFTKKDPKSLTDHIQRMALGEAPFFPETLGLVYSKLFRNSFPQPAASGSGHRKPPKAELTPFPVTPSTIPCAVLKCPQCDALARLEDLYNGFRCPHCPPPVRPIMQCPLCDTVRIRGSDSCIRRSCGIKFL